MRYYRRFIGFLQQGYITLFGQCLHRLILGLAFGLDVLDWLGRAKTTLAQRWARAIVTYGSLKLWLTQRSG